MEWNDHAIVLGSRHHGETSAIAELMTREHGRYLGLVRGGRSRKMRPVLQAGNLVSANWRARLDEHLGIYQIEPEKSRAASLMAGRASLYCVQIIAAHLRLLPERQAQQQLYNAANIILDNADDANISSHLILRFEVALLEELGFGLSLKKCAVSGTTENLIWVSPKTGCAVCAKEGKPWAAKLLSLPPFLAPAKTPLPQARAVAASAEELGAGFALTSHFLNRHVYGPRAIRPPDERARLAALVC